jgi:hypothetical protein
MPCRDYYDDHPELYFKEVTEPALKAQVSFAESALCAALSTIEKMLTKQGSGDFGYRDVYEAIDCDDAGITEAELRKWHKEHKATDLKLRRAAEKQAALKASALKKLTAEEKKALGLK